MTIPTTQVSLLPSKPFKWPCVHYVMLFVALSSGGGGVTGEQYDGRWWHAAPHHGERWGSVAPDTTLDFETMPIWGLLEDFSSEKGGRRKKGKQTAANNSTSSFLSFYFHHSFLPFSTPSSSCLRGLSSVWSSGPVLSLIVTGRRPLSQTEFKFCLSSNCPDLPMTPLSSQQVNCQLKTQKSATDIHGCSCLNA